MKAMRATAVAAVLAGAAVIGALAGPIANASDGFFENELQVLWNGIVVFDRKNLFPQGFTQVVIDPLATGPTSTLAFGFRDDSGLLHIDDVSVRAVSAVPEPSSLVLLGLGIAAIARLRAKRRQR
jgi:PEP-CTERM motif